MSKSEPLVSVVTPVYNKERIRRNYTFCAQSPGCPAGPGRDGHPGGLAARGAGTRRSQHSRQ